MVLAGEIDLITAAAVHSALEEAGRGAGPMTVDLTAVTYLASAGVAELFEHAETNDLDLALTN